MKETASLGKNSKSNIILEDKEMKDLIRQIVTRAHDDGYLITHLKGAIDITWKEAYPPPKDEEIPSLTPDQEKFKEKAIRFLQKYSDSILETYYHDDNVSEERLKFELQGFEDQSGRLFNIFLGILVSIYALFETSNGLRQTDMIKFARMHFKHYERTSSISFYINPLKKFVWTRLAFDPEDPKAQPAVFEPYNVHCLAWSDEFNKFNRQYKYTKTDANELAVAVMWLIPNFF